jgi:hypothetical protein
MYVGLNQVSIYLIIARELCVLEIDRIAFAALSWEAKAIVAAV